MIRLLVLLLLLGGPVAAQEFPALYDVTGVAADDVLNIRAEPRGGAELLGTLAPDRRGVEILSLSEDGGWGKVNTDLDPGWVSMRYMARQPGQEEWAFPLPAYCAGAEPFWGLDFRDGMIVFDNPDLQTANMIPVYPSNQHPWTGTRAFLGMTNVGTSVGVLRREWCIDGMSDYEFGIAVDFVLATPQGPIHLNGCCSLENR